MSQNQLIGIVLFVVALADTLIGQLFVAPRIADEAKRTTLRVAFVGSGLLLAGVGYGFYAGLIGT